MPHDFDLDSTVFNVKPYNPEDYGLPIWRDEDHQPKEDETKEQGKEVHDSMTIEAAKSKLCTWALSQAGYHEGPNNQTKYAENPDLQCMYGWKPQNQPWCDVFVDSGFIECFGLAAACAMTYQPMGAGSALCKQSAQYYKDHGAFFHTPEIGDQVFFYASGDINHTGIVVRVDGGSVHTVEGNSSDMVAERVYSASDGKIAGYGRPDWSVVEGEDVNIPTNDVADTNVRNNTEETDEQRFYELRFPYLKIGSTGESVKAVQYELQARAYSLGYSGVDGEYGHATEACVRDFQRRNGITPDGVVGPDTGAKLFGADVNFKANAINSNQPSQNLQKRKNVADTMKPKVEQNATEESKKATFALGTLVNFKGGKQYASPYFDFGKDAKPGKALIVSVKEKAKHPYSLLYENNGGSNVNGWVNAEDIEKR